ncbi:MAG TPA: selenocysteine-specific translation elongation factor [Baekduia sp.]
MTRGPLTLGTAGHIDHGKTALVGALTGVDTDRLPEERARGISIALGYAPLALPSGRRLSVVDVPGHERFVRTMVAGATGIDLYLMVVAADDGVMPQTVEHTTVLAALGVDAGVVAVTKGDVADPARAVGEARELLPGAAAVVPCSARTGEGVADVAAALDAVASELPGRAGRAGGGVVLHVDRVFTVKGIGTVVTGTLWSGTLRPGAVVEVLPGGREARARSVQVHDADVAAAEAGQRVAVNLAGVRPREVARGDVLAEPGVGGVNETIMLDCALALGPDARHGERVQVHHGTRDVAARMADLGDGLWQLRLERPVLAADGDRVVVRRLSPPDTLGGGVVLDARAAKHGRRREVLERLAARRDGRPEPRRAPVPSPPPHASAPSSPPPDAELAAVEERLLAAGLMLVAEAELPPEPLAALRDAGRAVRVSGRLYAHAETIAAARSQVIALIEKHGSTSLAEVRDALSISRKPAQALLEHLDTQRITRRLPDDRRVLRARRGAEASA